jgi:hypothetical protein
MPSSLIPIPVTPANAVSDVVITDGTNVVVMVVMVMLGD